MILVYSFQLRLVHSVCLWDEKGAQKVNDNLKEDIVNFIKLTKEVSTNMM